MHVGLVWAGNPNHPNDSNRSLEFARFSPVLATPGCRFFSLQVGTRAADSMPAVAAGAITDWSGRLTDFAATARALAALDLVITVDSAVAHAAGALGKPVWMVVPFAADWRWLRTGKRSPWYPSMTLFRQNQPGDWDATIFDVATALEKYAHEQQMVRPMSAGAELQFGVSPGFSAQSEYSKTCDIEQPAGNSWP